MGNLPLLEQRKIEAGVLIPVIRALRSRFGKDDVDEVVQQVIEDLAFSRGSQIAHERPATPIEMVKSLIPGFCEGGAIELEVIKDSAGAYDFNVTRCRYAEFYNQMGVPELGFLLSCNRDFALTRGISDRLELVRRRTIMQGDGHCDFRFRLLKQPAGGRIRG